jgi:hypothetical protein
MQVVAAVRVRLVVVQAQAEQLDQTAALVLFQQSTIRQLIMLVVVLVKEQQVQAQVAQGAVVQVQQAQERRILAVVVQVLLVLRVTAVRELSF